MESEAVRKSAGEKGKNLMVKIKICGLKTMEDIRMVNRQKPDFAGFVFAGSKRRITPEQAAEMKKELLPEIRSVGVFVNEDPERIAGLAEGGVLDYIQLHGDEDGEEIRWIKDRTGKPVIKAVRVRSREDILQAEKLPCEYLLLDTYKAGEYGGSGERFCWEMIPELEKPFFLAGGLNAENIAEALKTCRPWAVDVSSSVETDGRKDEEKVRRFMRAVRLEKYAGERGFKYEQQ